jgi:hypothetical protein
VSQDTLSRQDLVWLPTPRGWAYRADPFGIWHEDRLYVFVERFDYADQHGHIEVLTYNAELELLSIDPALSEPWHLSYPFVFSSGNDHWMLPEARRSGRLTLYRANSFPFEWSAELTIPLPRDAVDATPLFWNGKWWLFYCLKQRRRGGANELHIAFADKLDGPWQRHPLNPVRVGVADARPGGSPCVGDGYIDLPVQDASNGYGSALRRLRITVLNELRFEAEDQPWLNSSEAFAPFDAGLHTLSSAGAISLIDVKRIDGSPMARLFHQWTRIRANRRALD